MTDWMILKVLFIILNDESIIIFCLIGFSDVFNRDWRFFRCFQLRRGDDDGLFFSRQQVEKVVGEFCPLNGYFHEHILCQIVAPQRNRVFTVGICNLLFDGGFGKIQFVWPVEIIIFLGNRLAVFIAQPSMNHTVVFLLFRYQVGNSVAFHLARCVGFCRYRFFERFQFLPVKSITCT